MGRKAMPGVRSDGKVTRAYRSWLSMRQRCRNPNAPNFANYGGRGINIAPEWDSFQQFFADMGERPEGKTLDRIDTQRDYGAGNCKWSSPLDQVLNRAITKSVEIDGVKRPVRLVAAEHGISVMTYSARLGRGWAPLDAATRPRRPYPERGA